MCPKVLDLNYKFINEILALALAMAKSNHGKYNVRVRDSEPINLESPRSLSVYILAITI